MAHLAAELCTHIAMSVMHQNLVQISPFCTDTIALAAHTRLKYTQGNTRLPAPVLRHGSSWVLPHRHTGTSRAGGTTPPCSGITDGCCAPQLTALHGFYSTRVSALGCSFSSRFGVIPHRWDVPCAVSPVRDLQRAASTRQSRNVGACIVHLQCVGQGWGRILVYQIDSGGV